MKYIHNITTLLLAMTLALLLSACNTKTSQDENNTTGSSSPTTQTTEDTSATGSSGSSNATGGINNTTSGTDDNTTTGGGGNDNTTTAPTVTLKSLNLTVNKTSLNKDENTTVKVMATYSDNSSKEVTDKVEWIIVPSNTVKVTNTTLIALEDKVTIFKAKLKGKTSNAIDLNIIWVVNGHTLPPEPDKVLNDSTLLGIDTNNNGVRDDVERWIYETYKDKHPIYIDIAMQGAKAKQKILKNPSKAKNIHDEIRRPLQCESYFRVCIKNPKVSKPINTNKKFKRAIFNTKERIDAYNIYDSLLSGDSYTIPWCSERKQKCDFDTSKYGE